MIPHKKKMIAPIVVTLILVLYYALYFGFLISLIPGVFKYIFAIFPFIFAVLTIVVCVERIKEIKEGEEEDLSKY